MLRRTASPKPESIPVTSADQHASDMERPSPSDMAKSRIVAKATVRIVVWSVSPAASATEWMSPCMRRCSPCDRGRARIAFLHSWLMASKGDASRNAASATPASIPRALMSMGPTLSMPPSSSSPLLASTAMPITWAGDRMPGVYGSGSISPTIALRFVRIAYWTADSSLGVRFASQSPSSPARMSKKSSCMESPSE